MSENSVNKIAVVGAGVAGIVASHLLQRNANVTIYEKSRRLGGHTNTIVIDDGPDSGTPVDTGFIVLNDQTYPLLHKFLSELNCPVRFSDMSFGYYSQKSGFYYAGTNLSGLFAQKRNLLRPSFYRFLHEIVGFGKRAINDLMNDRVGDVTLGEYTRNISAQTRNCYIIPMAAAIWSATQADIMDFPARTLLSFWKNHGLLSLANRPRWQTVVGGSHQYIKAFSRSFCGQIRLGARIHTIRRNDKGVEIIHANGETDYFDDVVIATHADEALALLDKPTSDETRLLAAWRYQKNRTLLHTDTSFLPPDKKAWASWNYMEHDRLKPDAPVPVTYYMNLLQGLKTNDTYCVTLNPDREPKPGTIVREIEYMHPVYDRNAVATQNQLPGLNGKNRTWFCGSYFGYGFHEDAVRSAVMVAKEFGVSL
ncbi:MAG TPA: FAD-dependent oxidoreductase [Kiritimatiellia bacterium]|nr:FAD-dependent oxidoreductase [Kiritimatiellia bacterium]